MKSLDVVAAIIHRRGEILLAQRPPDGDQPGLWEFPGGKLEPGESQPQALIRELREELGIQATVGSYIASQRQQVSGRIIHLHAWAVPDFQGKLQLLSHSALVWCRPEAAMTYPLAPADIPLLAAFMASPAARPAD
ncbi:pyrimidine (deoxy)nucleoside triphosphate diphosphatase [Erwinia sp. CPCC 100877]|nr:pyrimidine (deoxy)nucleoside triphosphate diphosphatase [Erwinia sp. CPCC 100877]